MALYTSLAKQKGVLHEGEVLNYKNGAQRVAFHKVADWLFGVTVSTWI